MGGTEVNKVTLGTQGDMMGPRHLGDGVQGSSRVTQGNQGDMGDPGIREMGWGV